MGVQVRGDGRGGDLILGFILLCLELGRRGCDRTPAPPRALIRRRVVCPLAVAFQVPVGPVGGQTAPQAPGRSRLGTPLEAAIQYNYFMNCIFPILLRAGSDLPASCAEVPYVQRVIDAGSFKNYERAHLARLTSTFVPKFPHLPPELVRNVVSFWLHAGEY